MGNGSSGKHSSAIEAEIVTEPQGFSYRQKYNTYNYEAKSISKIAWIFGLLSLPFALIPVFGFLFAAIALVVNLVKRTPPILPVIALVISGLITSFFLILSFIISAIF